MDRSFDNGIGFIYQTVSSADEVDVSANRLFNETDAHLTSTYRHADSIVVREESLSAVGESVRGWTITFGHESDSVSVTLVLMYAGDYFTSLTICNPDAGSGFVDQILAAAADKLTR